MLIKKVIMQTHTLNIYYFPKQNLENFNVDSRIICDIYSMYFNSLLRENKYKIIYFTYNISNYVLQYQI